MVASKTILRNPAANTQPHSVGQPQNARKGDVPSGNRVDPAAPDGPAQSSGGFVRHFAGRNPPDHLMRGQSPTRQRAIPYHAVAPLQLRDPTGARSDRTEVTVTTPAAAESLCAVRRPDVAWRLAVSPDGPGTADAFVAHTNARVKGAWGGQDGVYEMLKNEWRACVADGLDRAGFIAAGTTAQGHHYFRVIGTATCEAAAPAEAPQKVRFSDPTKGPDALGPYEHVVGTYVVHGAWPCGTTSAGRWTSPIDDAFILHRSALLSGRRASEVPSLVVATNPNATDEAQMWDVESPGATAAGADRFLRPLQNFDDLAGDKVPGDDRPHASPAPSLLLRSSDPALPRSHVDATIGTPSGRSLTFPMRAQYFDLLTQETSGSDAWAKTKSILGVAPADYGADGSVADHMRHTIIDNCRWLMPRAGTDTERLCLADLENWYISRLMGDPGTNAPDRMPARVRREIDRAVTYFLEHPEQLPCGSAGQCTVDQIRAMGATDPLQALSRGVDDPRGALDALCRAICENRLTFAPSEVRTEQTGTSYSLDALHRAVSNPEVALGVRKQLACLLLPRHAALLEALDRDEQGKTNGYLQLPPAVGKRDELDGLAARLKPEGYELIWNDEFYQPGLGIPDPNRWSYDLGDGRQAAKHTNAAGELVREPWNRWGNNELQHYTGVRTDKPNAVVDNGTLRIIARREQYGSSDYTSARLNTRESMKFGPNHRLEIEASVAGVTKGGWAALWTMGDAFNPTLGGAAQTASWPQCGELDVMEYAPSNTQPGWSPTRVSTAAHAYGAAADWCPNTQVDFDPTQKHTFAMEWTRDRDGTAKIRTYVDDLEMHTFTLQEYLDIVRKSANDAVWNQWFPDVSKRGDWSFDDPERALHVIMNIAVGGNLGGLVKPPSGPWESQMTVDSVRLFEKKKPAEASA